MNKNNYRKMVISISSLVLSGLVLANANSVKADTTTGTDQNNTNQVVNNNNQQNASQTNTSDTNEAPAGSDLYNRLHVDKQDKSVSRPDDDQIPNTVIDTANKSENLNEYFKGNSNDGRQVLPGKVTDKTDIELTPDKPNTVGGISLKNKIDLSSPFSIIGDIRFAKDYPTPVLNYNEGSRGNTNYADGIGFIFHTGDPTQLGASGADMGAGGLPNVKGFKLDLYRNTYQAPDKNATNLSDKLGWEEDPAAPGHPGFGTTIETKYETHNGVTGWFVHQSTKDMQDLIYYKTSVLATPKYYDIDNGDTSMFAISYNLDNGGTLTLSYFGKRQGEDDKQLKSNSWEMRGIRDYYNKLGENAVAFSIQAATGSISAIQSIRMKYFAYKPLSGNVTIGNHSSVYDGKNVSIMSSTNAPTIHKTDFSGDSVAVPDFAFQDSDFVYYDKDGKQLTAAPVDVGTYTVMLSDSGMERIYDLEKKSNENNTDLHKVVLNFGDLNSYRGTYTITARPVTIDLGEKTASTKDASKVVNDTIANAKADDPIFNQEESQGTVVKNITPSTTNYEPGQTVTYSINLTGKNAKNFVVSLKGSMKITDDNQGNQDNPGKEDQDNHDDTGKEDQGSQDNPGKEDQGSQDNTGKDDQGSHDNTSNDNQGNNDNSDKDDQSSHDTPGTNDQGNTNNSSQNNHNDTTTESNSNSDELINRDHDEANAKNSEHDSSSVVDQKLEDKASNSHNSVTNFEPGSSSQTVEKMSEHAEGSRQKLPQTGAKETSSIMGLILMLFGAVLGWFGKKRTDQD